jgi:hypothetical protein
MKKQTRNLLIAAAVVLILVIIAYWYWFTKDTVKLVLTGFAAAPAPAAAGAIALVYTYSGKSDPSTWSGKKITIHTKSLGKIKSTVASATASGLTTAASAYPSKGTYAVDKSDYARVTLKY